MRLPRIRITLRWLMLLVAVAALPLFWAANEVRRRDFSARAAAANAAATASQNRILKLAALADAEGLKIYAPGSGPGVIGVQFITRWERDGSPNPRAAEIVKEFQAFRRSSNQARAYERAAKARIPVMPFIPSEPEPR